MIDYGYKLANSEFGVANVCIIGEAHIYQREKRRKGFVLASYFSYIGHRDQSYKVLIEILFKDCQWSDGVVLDMYLFTHCIA